MNIKKIISKFLPKKKFNSEQLISGIKDGSITVLEKGHLINPIQQELMKTLDRLKEYVKVSPGECIGVFHTYHCFNCDFECVAVLTDEKTIALIPQDEYWNIQEKNGKKYKFKESDSKTCEAQYLENQEKLVSKIHLSTGNIVFKNYFQTDKLYMDQQNRFKKPGINSLLGRNKLMQYLAKENVGYGQMGNMSVAIYYSKKKNQIIISDPYLEESIEYVKGEIKNPRNPSNKSEKALENLKKELERLELSKKELKGFRFKGKISLSVWRWMCTDKSVLDENNEPLQSEEFEDMVNFQVKKGDWEIEHYFDFVYKGNKIYSKITLIN